MQIAIPVGKVTHLKALDQIFNIPLDYEQAWNGNQGSKLRRNAI